LRILFAVNGIANVAGGALLLPLAGILDGPTGLSRSLLVGIGVFYLVYGSAMWFAATRPRPRPAAIVALIAVNLIWAIDCLLMVGTIVAHPTTLGSVLLAAEAATVTGLAALQHAGYRGSRVPDVGTPDEPMARRGAATIQQARG
jgi:hypothetical protein